ncbi:MAG: hypothetical protein M4D80_21015 [Myxococcota bacterium]|nr:hypothetical protein [Myxococcota bacterium]
MADAYVHDATSMCATTTPPTCVTGSNILRECKVVGQMAIDISCSWGCITGAPHHCGRLVPSGGGLVVADLAPTAGLQDKTFNVNGGGITINTDNGSISNYRSNGTGIINGIEFKVNNNVGVFRFNKLTMTTLDGSNVRVVGANALAIASLTTIDVERVVIDMQGDCQGTNAGPGGRPGGAANTTAGGNGGGAAGGSYNSNDSGGGGGGGYGKNGGTGGVRAGETPAPGGAAFGNAAIVTLMGGGGGGGGGGDGAGGVGGGGGGAIQLAANGVTRLTGVIGRYAGITAGGCGGKGATSGDAGGGGGAGGAVLIEAPTIQLNIGGVAVNGGGGGGGETGSPGSNGGFALNRAGGGGAINGGGAGAQGGAQGTLTGGNGVANDNAGGGGGGVGWIRMNTVSGGVSMQNASFVSPSFNDTGTTATRAMAIVE